MTIGETELMGADIPNAQPVRSAYLTLIVDSTDEAERIYASLSAGGEIFMPLTGLSSPSALASLETSLARPG
jgi:PhnB protein